MHSSGPCLQRRSEENVTLIKKPLRAHGSKLAHKREKSRSAIVSEDKLDSDVCKGAFWGDRMEGNAGIFPDCVITID